MNRLSAPAASRGCIDLSDIHSLTSGTEEVAELCNRIKHQLRRSDQVLAQRFWEGEDVAELVRARAWVVEQLLLEAWKWCITDQPPTVESHPCLIAVGGFGRGELHPHSDVDLLILVAEMPPEASGLSVLIESFIQLLWDAGFYLGHSVRTLETCISEAERDVATATSLMESRLLDGPRPLFKSLCSAISVDRIWPANQFFKAKFEEQELRHARYFDTAYNLEPNIKEGQGGLRDIQMISWVTKRHFGVQTLHGLVEHGFLTSSEYADLETGQKLLWRVRFALHLLAGRAEDRLLFDHQREIALRFGFVDIEANLAVEQFMQGYYRNVMQLERLNERLLQLFQEELIYDSEGEAVPVTSDFSARHGFIEIRDGSLLIRRPAAMMELFVLLARDPELRGVRASTVRTISDHVHLIDDTFRNDPEVNLLFLELLTQPQGVYTQLSRMNRYGVLAAYLPAFGNIVGRMQYDLFHVYTVDQHTLFVVRNLRRFAYGKYREQFPHAQSVFRRIERPELLYLAAIFHDIAKGRGGDHSELGEVDAHEFTLKLDLEDEERELISWLVRNHLLMSRTAQREDLSDPTTIQQFAAVVKTMARLDSLYLLTVADIAATSPKLWNSWKNSLLWDLYLSAGNALRRGLKNPVDRETRIRQRRARTLSRLLRRGVPAEPTQRLWDTLPEHAFLRLTAGQLEWASQAMTDSGPGDDVIAVRSVKPQGISEVLVCVADHDGLFAAITSVFDEMHLNVLSARVLTTSDDRSFDLFQVADQDGRALIAADSEVLKGRLALATSRGGYSPVQRRLPRRLKHFSSQPVISFSCAADRQGTLMELECNDRPGLLSRLATAIADSGVQVHDARIATFGERVEDTFLLSDSDNNLLDEETIESLTRAIEEHLNN
ncbi:MAG TPA: [protein-PII] uridylyltransferase [Xanthomonadales bacterium]|nr:[protein-PII] uridylyltransferase [Xanthomonadales bacterium]